MHNGVLNIADKLNKEMIKAHTYSYLKFISYIISRYCRNAAGIVLIKI